MKNRKVAAFILTLSLLFSTFSASFAVTEVTSASTDPVAFSDVTDHWGSTAILKWAGYGIINGYEGLFRPDDPITRGEMAVILDNMMDYQVVAANTFIDLPSGQFYTDAVLKANAAGIMKGDGVTVRPTDKITKEEAAIMMSRAFAVTEANSTKAFLDASAVSDWAKGAVFGMEAKGYVSGFEGYFNPKNNITRAEAVTMINNIVKAYYTAAGTYTDNVAGTAVIKVPNVILKGSTITENLIIAEGVGNGDATLNSVTVKGETVIRGGGENSVHITGNSVITKVTIEKVGDKLRVVIDDGITVNNVEVAAGEEIIITGSVGTVELNAPNVTVYANAAEISTATISGDNSTIVVGAQSTLTNVTVTSTADNTSIRTETGAVVGAITASSEIEVSGTGTVTKVTLQTGADGSSVTTPNTATTVPTGVSGVTGGGGASIPAGSTGTNGASGTTTVVTTTPTTGGSGGSGSSTIAVTGVTVTSTAVTISSDNGTLQMTAVVEPSNATNKNVTWSVTNGTGYATINSSGLLTAVSNGTVTVNAISVSNGTVSGALGITLSSQTDDAITTAGATRTSPAVGEPGANASVSASAKYTHVSTTWSGKAGANYAIGETPAAIITLQANTGYTFTGLAAGSISVAGGTVTYGGGQGVVSAGAFVVFTVTYPQLTASITTATAITTAPAIGEAGANVAVLGTANYTHTSTVWSGRAGGTYVAGEVPIATVTLTAKTGYSFTGISYSSITAPGGGPVSFAAGQGVTAGGASVVFTVSCPQLIGSLSAATVTVTAPALGVTPPNAAAVEAATSNANYTVSNVTWNGSLTSTGKFKADTAYSANIVLTSKNFYKFQAGAFTPTLASALSVGTTTTVGTEIGNTVSFTASFTTTGAVAVSSISVSTQPTQLSYFEGTALSLNGLVIVETNNDTSTAAALFPSGVNANYSASPANGTTLTTAYNGTPVAITHTASGKIATTTALSVASTVSAISGADVTLTAGSIVFDYDFTGTGGAITYADALAGPYYLDAVSSTVTLKNSTSSSSAVSVSALGLAADGTVSYAAISNIQSAFTGLTFIPTQVAISLKGATAINGGSNQWTYNINIDLDPAEIALMTPTVITSAAVSVTVPAIGVSLENGAVAPGTHYIHTSTTWTGKAGATYAAGETPSAIISLAADTDYTFTGLAAGNITVAGGTVSFAAGQGVTTSGVSVTFTVSYPQLVNTITSASVTVTAPVLGATPENTGTIQAATSNAAFTVSNVLWNEALTSTGKFKAGQAYTASFTLTAKSGYEFAGAGVTATVAGSASVGTVTTSGSGIGNAVSFTASYATTGALTISSISVTTQPTKLSYMELTDDVLDLSGMEISETYNDTSTGSATFAGGTNVNYTASPANGATLTTAYNGTPVAITHTGTGKVATTAALTVLSTVSAISGTDVTLTAGSIVFDYDFTGTSGAISYAQGQLGPYYLNPVASTVTLTDGVSSTSAVSLSALGISDDGVVSYGAITSIGAVFAGLDFIPTQVTIHLVGATTVNSGANAWTYDTSVALALEEIDLLTPDPITAVTVSVTAPAIGVTLENAAVAPGSNCIHTTTVWTGKAGATYAAGETPAAIVSLSANTDYTFTGLTAGDITVAGGTVSFAAGQGVTAGGMAVTFTVSYSQLIASITTAGAVCTSPTIGGVVASAPDATVDAGAGYTHSTTVWSGAAGANWAAGETPAATITLAAKTGYTFTGLTYSSITVAGGTVSYEPGQGVQGGGASVVFTATYPQLLAASTPTSITLTAGTTAAALAITDVVIPASGATDSTGAFDWAAGTNDRIRFTVTDDTGTSTITIDGASYTSGNDYTVTRSGLMTIVVTTTEAGKGTCVRTFSITAYPADYATTPTAIELAAGGTNSATITANITTIPAPGGTNAESSVTGWITGTNDRIKFNVTASGTGESSTIKINGGAYTSGNDYTITTVGSLTIVVTTTQTDKVTAIRTFTVPVTAAPYATTPSSIEFAAGSSNSATIGTNITTIPGPGTTNSQGVLSGWNPGTSDTIKFNVTDAGGSSAITINGSAYTSGNDYTIASSGAMSIIVTTTEAGKTPALRTFSVQVSDNTSPSITAIALHDNSAGGIFGDEPLDAIKLTFSEEMDTTSVPTASDLDSLLTFSGADMDGFDGSNFTQNGLTIIFTDSKTLVITVTDPTGAGNTIIADTTTDKMCVTPGVTTLRDRAGNALAKPITGSDLLMTIYP